MTTILLTNTLLCQCGFSLFIVKYTASRLRGINLITLQPSAHVNIIVGNNNAGKTSLIEGIYYSSTQKSFKTINTENLIQSGEESLKILLNVDKFGENIDIYTEKNLNAINIAKINNKRSSAKTLSLAFPCIALSFGVENIINQSSENRRSFLDWGSFHVKPTHSALFTNYTKALKQRNLVLKKGDYDNLDYWTQLLSKHGVELHNARASYFNLLYEQFVAHTEALASFDEDTYKDIKNTSISYSPGWDLGLPLYDSIVNNSNKDRTLKYTTRGPHRADIIFDVQGVPLKSISSMSTQVIVSLLLVLSQAEVFHVKQG